MNTDREKAIEQMQSNAKMMARALSLLDPREQLAICIGTLDALAKANTENPHALNHGFVPSENGFKNAASFITALGNEAEVNKAAKPTAEIEA